MPLNPGDTLNNDHYRILRQLGRGGFGFVYLAQDTLLGEQVAIKELIPALVGDETMLKRFLTEARATMRLRHKRIVATHNVFHQDGNYYIVMEYMVGGSLEERLRAGGPLPVDEAVHMAAEVCEGLACAHEEQVVHCDLKPANILFDKEGHAKVADFGIAHVSGEMLTRSWMTPAGFVAGTLPYMSPEQADGVRDEPRIDVYALGAVLYRALTGRTYLMFDQQETPRAQMENLQRIYTAQPAAPSTHHAGIPPWLDAVILKALAKRREERYASAEAMRAALMQRQAAPARPMSQPPLPATRAIPERQQAVSGHPSASRVPAMQEAAAVPASKRKAPLPTSFWAIGAGAVVLLVLLIVAIAALTKGGDGGAGAATRAPTVVTQAARTTPTSTPTRPTQATIAPVDTRAPTRPPTVTPTRRPTHTPRPTHTVTHTPRPTATPTRTPVPPTNTPTPSSTASGGGPANSAWPVFQHDVRRTSQSPYAGPSRPGLKWTYSISENSSSSPVLGSDGIIYVGGNDKQFHAVNPDGTQKWTYDVSSFIWGSGAVSADGMVYFGHVDYDTGQLVALDSGGSLNWTYPARGVRSSPGMLSDGTIYVGSSHTRLYAINPDGTLKWSYQPGFVESYSAPAIAGDGTIYVTGAKDGNLHALNPDGTTRWTYNVGGDTTSTPTIDDNGTIYAGGTGNRLYAVSPNGTLKWSYALDAHLRGNSQSAAIGPDGTVYAISAGAILYAFTPEGVLKWTYPTGAPETLTTPTVDSDGDIYFSARNGQVYAVKPDGTKKWTFQSPVSRLLSNIALGVDGTLYVTGDGGLYAIGEY